MFAAASTTSLSVLWHSCRSLRGSTAAPATQPAQQHSQRRGAARAEAVPHRAVPSSAASGSAAPRAGAAGARRGKCDAVGAGALPQQQAAASLAPSLETTHGASRGVCEALQREARLLAACGAATLGLYTFPPTPLHGPLSHSASWRVSPWPAAVCGLLAPAVFRTCMLRLPRTFSHGECSVLTQGLLLLATAAVQAAARLPFFVAAVAHHFLRYPAMSHAEASTPLADLTANGLVPAFVVLLTATVAVGAVSVTALFGRSARSARMRWLPALACSAGAATSACTTSLLAAWTLLIFLPAAPRRTRLVAYWAALLMVALPAMHTAARRKTAAQVRACMRVCHFALLEAHDACEGLLRARV